MRRNAEEAADCRFRAFFGAVFRQSPIPILGLFLDDVDAMLDGFVFRGEGVIFFGIAEWHPVTLCVVIGTHIKRVVAIWKQFNAKLQIGIATNDFDFFFES